MSLFLPIDHLVILTDDLQEARDAFVGAGFTTSPIARHSPQMGTANSCIMLDNAYVELMGIVAPTPANESWRALLTEGAGLKGIALASNDIDVTALDLRAAGIEAEPPRHFSREMDEGELRFSVIRLPRVLTPGLQCIYCQHHTRKLLWTASALRHPNGATRLLGATLRHAGTLQPFAVPEGPEAIQIEEGEGAVEIAFAQGIDAASLRRIEAATSLRLLGKITT